MGVRNFIDRVFTVISDLILKLLPASKQEKQAFAYYKAGMAAQAEGDYAEALENYYESLYLDEDQYDRSYTLYNIGLIYGKNENYPRALEYYHQAVSLNSNLPQALNNIAAIYHRQGLLALEMSSQNYDSAIEISGEYEYIELAKGLFDKAAEYWYQALKLAPDNYPRARNWLRITGRAKLLDSF
jgi:tetratricopeptide (TPR) repeat protein